MNYRPLRIWLGIVLALLFFLGPIRTASAQTKEYVPPGIIKLSLETAYQGDDMHYDTQGSEVTGRTYIANIYNLDHKLVTGSYRRQQIDTRVGFLIGLYGPLALELSGTYASVTESNSLEYSGSDSSNDNPLAEYLDDFQRTGTTSGVKAANANLIVEALFTRTLGILFGIGYQVAGPTDTSDSASSPFISYGINYLKAFGQIGLYSREIPYSAFLRVDYAGPQNTSRITLADNNTVSYSDGSYFNLNAEQAYRIDEFALFLSLHYFSLKNSTVNTIGINNGQSIGSVKIGVRHDNLPGVIRSKGAENDLRLGVWFERSIFGRNAPVKNQISLSIDYVL